MSTPQMNKMFEFVVAFIKREAAKEDITFELLEQDWNSKENKSEFKKMFKKTVKTLKDPKAPKKGRSAYIFYCLDKRQEIVEANPDAAATDIVKLLGAAWKALGGEEKKQYQEQAAEDKERYATESKDYAAPSQDELKDQAAAKKKKDPNAPKRGKSAYLFFCQDKRAEIKAENPEAKGPEILKLLGAAWHEISADEKKKYEAQASEDKDKYLEAKAKYEGKSEDEEEESEDKPEKKEKESPKDKPEKKESPKDKLEKKESPKDKPKKKASKDQEDDEPEVIVTKESPKAKESPKDKAKGKCGKSGK